MKKYVMQICIIAAVCLLGATAFCGYHIYDHYAHEAEQTEAFEQIAEVVEQAQTGEEAPQVPLNEEETILPEYGELFLQNPDMVGWISIAGTKLNYPVMQTPNNPNFYLKHNFEKAYSDLGTPYIQENCNIAESDNLVIYGHHIKGGKMFGALNDYKSKSFYEEHKTILFDTLTEQAEYEIVAVFKTVAYSSEGFRYYDFVNAENAEAFDEYIAKCKELKKVVESLLEYQWFRDIVSKSSYKATLPDESTQMWKNTNAFLDSTSDYYNGNVKGVKTGSLSDDYNLVVLYQQHGKEFLICSLGSKSNSSRYDDVNYIIKTIDESDYLSR